MQIEWEIPTIGAYLPSDNDDDEIGEDVEELAEIKAAVFTQTNNYLWKPSQMGATKFDCQ